MKKLQILFLAIVLANSAFAQYSGGSGTSGDPYQIATTDDLIELSNTSGDWGNHFIQTADITFHADEQNVDWDGDGDAIWDAQDQLGLSPIGNTTINFTGSYDGQENEISNLFLDRGNVNQVGLFGHTDGATVENIGVVDCEIIGNSSQVGCLVGLNNNSSSVVNCYSTGSVDGFAPIGGLVGLNQSSTVTNSYSSSVVVGFANVGGLVGTNNSSGSVVNCYSTGAVTSSNERVGGLVGLNQSSSSVVNSYSTGAVTGTNDDVGGLVGQSEGNCSIENSYSTGAVDGVANVGGLVGLNYGSIEYCYSVGTVTGSGSNVGGFIGGSGSGTLVANYWKTDGAGGLEDTGNSGNIADIDETSDANMKIQGTFLGWDFTDDWAISSTITFDGYPTLQWTGAYSEAPTSDEITSVMNLVWLAEDDSRWAADYTQTADINLWTTPSWDGNNGFSPIGNITTNFTGTYDGQEYEISNLFIDRSTTDNVGLFGLADGSTIENLGVVDCDISGDDNVGGLVGRNDNSSTVTNSYSIGAVTGSGDRVGGLVGLNYNSSSITNSYSTGAVTGIGNSVGGLVGRNNTSSGVENSYSTGAVTGNSQVGGLVGWNNISSTITNSYSTGAVDGDSDVGGLVGDNNSSSSVDNSYSTGAVDGSGNSVGGLVGYNDNGSVEYCYSVGTVTGSGSNIGGFIGQYDSGTLTANYWRSDGVGGLEDTGDDGDIGGIDETSDADMKIQSTYLGWDFTNIWSFVSGENNDYPVHYWQYPQTAPIAYSPSFSNITANSASFSADVFDGGVSTTVTFEYGLISGDYSSGTTTSQTISGSSATVNVGFDVSSLESGTFYYAVARAENSVSFSYSEETSFWTLVAEPASHSSTFWQSGEELDKVVLNFDAFSGITNADGYLILRSNTSIGDSDLPTDGDSYNINDTFGNSTVVAKITDNTAISHTFNNLAQEKSWQFALVPYNEGANVATTNYKLDNVPTIQGFTIPTLGEWGMIVFGGLMLVVGAWQVRRMA